GADTYLLAALELGAQAAAAAKAWPVHRLYKGVQEMSVNPPATKTPHPAVAEWGVAGMRLAVGYACVVRRRSRLQAAASSRRLRASRPKVESVGTSAAVPGTTTKAVGSLAPPTAGSSVITVVSLVPSRSES